jgi:hypothetical protein
MKRLAGTDRRPLDLTDEAERRRGASAAAGRFRSDVGDLSVNPDKYLEDACRKMEKTRVEKESEKAPPKGGDRWGMKASGEKP